VFYALQGPSVFPEAAMLCPILLRAARVFSQTHAERRCADIEWRRGGFRIGWAGQDRCLIADDMP
jgi:hypothetical protein